MNQLCFQCQEAAKGVGCTTKGVCGKTLESAGLHDLLVFTLKGLAVVAEAAEQRGHADDGAGPFVCKALFSTITNANFDTARSTALIDESIARRDAIKAGIGFSSDLDAVNWSGSEQDYPLKAMEVGVLSEPNEDVRSLRELLIYGVKGMAAYAEHAAVLGFEDPAVYRFMIAAMASTTRPLGVPGLIDWVQRCGEFGVTAMALLDQANTATYGHPEITRVNLGVRGNPGILISGHDLKDLEELLAQTEGTGVDVYTHSEMLPAHYYPAFKQYAHFAGNYGNAWWEQDKEFAAFNGPILMTTNCMHHAGQAGLPRSHLHHRPDRLARRAAHRRAPRRRQQGLLRAHRPG